MRVYSERSRTQPMQTSRQRGGAGGGGGIQELQRRMGGAALPLPEPRTPRSSRSAERRAQRELQRLAQQRKNFKDEIRTAQDAPVASKACQEALHSIRSYEDPLFTRGHRWFDNPPTSSRWWSCICPS